MDTVTIGQRFAKAVAEHINRHMFQPHRGVIEVRNPFGGSCIAAFGNDGYRQDERTRAYVDALLEELGRLHPVLGLDSDEGYTWAIVVPMDDLFLGAVIEVELYAKYRESRELAEDDGFVIARKAICDREIMEHTNHEPLTISGWESVN
jgi:hypothetical protein